MYGLALLNSDYTGDAITVRRASDNATQNIGFDGQDLDIAALESFCSATDGFVTTLFDQSGNGFDAVQTTASSQPQIVSSGSVLLENGLPSMNFDGVDDDIVAANLTTELDSSPFSIFTVSRNGRYGITGAVPRLYLNESTYSYNNLSIISWIRDDYALRSYFAQSDNTHEVFENSVSKGTATETLVDFSPTDFLIGRTGGSYTANKIQTVIVFTSEQGGNRTGIETALNDYYSIY